MKPGKLSENILERSVFKNIKKNKIVNQGAAVGTDCAFFAEKAVATGYVANEKMITGDKITPLGRAIYRATNNMAAECARAEAVTLSLTLPEEYREIRLKELMQGAAIVAEKVNVAIAGGHTESLADIKNPVITVTAIGKANADKNAKKIKPGQALVMTKWLGISGAAHIVREYREKLEEKLPKFILDTVEEMEQFYSVIPEAAVAEKLGDTCMHDVSDGGIFAALWQLAKRENIGIEVDLRKIPVRQETIEVCEFFDINPYKLRSDGSLLIITENPDKLIEELNKMEIMATNIGVVTDNNDKVIVAGEERRYLEQPRQDEVYML